MRVASCMVQAWSVSWVSTIAASVQARHVPRKVHVRRNAMKPEAEADSAPCRPSKRITIAFNTHIGTAAIAFRKPFGSIDVVSIVVHRVHSLL